MREGDALMPKVREWTPLYERFEFPSQHIREMIKDEAYRKYEERIRGERREAKYSIHLLSGFTSS
jgi:hypothetical protein